MRDLEISLQQGAGEDRLGGLKAEGDRVGGIRGNFGVRSVSVGGSLLFWILSRLQFRRGCILRYVGVGELDLRLLRFSVVGRWRVGVRSVDKELLIVLVD